MTVLMCSWRVTMDVSMGLAAQAVFIKKGVRGEMTKAPISLQDLRRRLYVKAKAESTWRFWDLYVHVCNRETPRAMTELRESTG